MTRPNSRAAFVRLHLPLLLGAGLTTLALLGAGNAAGQGASLTADPLSPSAIARATCRSDGGSTALLRRLASANAETKPFRADEAPRPTAAPVPLFGKLGASRLDAASVSPAARPWLDQGLRFAYAFNHDAAADSFRQGQAADPSCVLCFWGEALVLGPNINAPLMPGANETALAALERARALLAKATPKERALVEALSRRYSADPKAERAALDAAYADAMGEVARRFPDDPEIAVLAAEAMMDTQPWDYWEAAGTRPKGRGAEIRMLLERALKQVPDHAGALHYYIHLMEASATPQVAEPHADRLAGLGLEAGHLVHMPSHLYYRIGRYKDSIDANLKAIEADEAMLARMPQTGMYPSAYYPHNIHFAMVAAQMAGDGPTVLSTSAKLARVVDAPKARAVPWVQPIMAAPYFAHAQYSGTEAVLALPHPGEGLPFVEGLWHYARGVALAQAGRPADALKEADAIAAAKGKGGEALAALAAGGTPAAEILGIAETVVRARAARAKGDTDGAVRLLQAARAVEAELRYTEPPHWYFPIRQALGAQLLLAGRVDEAEAAFRESLSQSPNNGRALFGLVQVAKARGDKAALRAAEADLDRAWVGDRALLSLERL